MNFYINEIEKSDDFIRYEYCDLMPGELPTHILVKSTNKLYKTRVQEEDHGFYCFADLTEEWIENPNWDWDSVSKPKYIIKSTKNILLTEIKGYKVVGSDGEFLKSVKGYYKDYNIAIKDAEHIGLWGSKGDVTEITLYTDGEWIYNLDIDKRFKFKDELKEYKEKTIASIKEKLTKEELELLNIK